MTAAAAVIPMTRSEKRALQQRGKDAFAALHETLAQGATVVQKSLTAKAIERELHGEKARPGPLDARKGR